MKKLIILPFLLIALFFGQSVFADSSLDVPSPFCLGTSCAQIISPSVPPSSAPSPTIFVGGSPSISPSASISAQPSGETATPSASPEVSPNPSSSPSGTPSNPAGPVCTNFNQFINNLTSGNTTNNTKVHIKCGSGGGGGDRGGGNNGGNNGSNPNNGLISQLISLIIQLLLQLFQLCGVQPINGIPSPSGAPLPSLSLSGVPSGVVPSKAAQPSQSQNQPSQSQNQPSQGQNQPSQAQNQPSQSQNQPSQSQNQPSNQPSQSQSSWGYAKPNTIAVTSTASGTNCTTTSAPFCTAFNLTVTWTPPTTTATGATLSSVGASAPTNYTVEVDYDITSQSTGIYKTVTNKTATSPYKVTLSNVTAPYTSIIVKVTANGAPSTSQTGSVTTAPGNWSFAAPAVKETTTGTTTWTMTVTWAPVTKTTTGITAPKVPTNYTLAAFASDGTTVIGGISNTSKTPVNKLTNALCGATCTQTLSTSDATIIAKLKNKAIIKVSAAGGTGAPVYGQATVQVPGTTATACAATVPNVMGDTLAAAQTTLKNAKFTVGVNTNSKSGNIISQTPGPGDKSTASCTVDIESDNLTTTTACTSSSTSGRCTWSACTANQISGKGAPYCETAGAHKNGTGGYYYTGFCPGGNNFECWVPGATSAKTATGNPVLPSCSSAGGVCTPTATLPVSGGFTVLQGTCSSGNTCIKKAQTCTGAGDVCLASGTMSKSLSHESTYDTTCSTNLSTLCYKVNSTTPAGACKTAGGTCLATGTTSKSLTHIPGTSSANDKSCNSGTTLSLLCYKVSTVSSAAVPGSTSVFSQAVDQTASAITTAWNAITSPIVHLLTSL